MKNTKKLLSILFLIFFSLGVYAQEPQKQPSVNEVKKQEVQVKVKENQDKIKPTVKNVAKTIKEKPQKHNDDVKQLYKTNVKPEKIKAVEKDKGILGDGLFWAFLVVLLGGFLTSLTPCAFPIIEETCPVPL